EHQEARQLADDGQPEFRCFVTRLHCFSLRLCCSRTRSILASILLSCVRCISIMASMTAIFSPCWRVWLWIEPSQALPLPMTIVVSRPMIHQRSLPLLFAPLVS